MEPRDALKILSDATRKIKAERDDHQLWVEAINTLARAIQPPPKETAVGE